MASSQIGKLHFFDSSTILVIVEGLAKTCLSSFNFFILRVGRLFTVRNRMKSVKSIQKITKAMKMVAASKLRGIQSKTESSRGFWQPFVALTGDHPGAYQSALKFYD